MSWGTSITHTHLHWYVVCAGLDPDVRPGKGNILHGIKDREMREYHDFGEVLVGLGRGPDDLAIVAFDAMNWTGIRNRIDDSIWAENPKKHRQRLPPSMAPFLADGIDYTITMRLGEIVERILANKRSFVDDLPGADIIQTGLYGFVSSIHPQNDDLLAVGSRFGMEAKTRIKFRGIDARPVPEERKYIQTPGGLLTLNDYANASRKP